MNQKLPMILSLVFMAWPGFAYGSALAAIHNDIAEKRRLDLADIVIRFKDDDQKVRAAAVRFLVGERDRLTDELLKFIEQRFSEGNLKASDGCNGAIALVGYLRSLSAIPLMVDNIAYQPKRFIMGGSALSMENGFPCTACLIRIGPACIQSVKKAVVRDDKFIECAAIVFHETLGPQLASRYVRHLVNSEENAKARDRLRLLEKKVEGLAQTDFIKLPPETLNYNSYEFDERIAQDWQQTLNKLRSKEPAELSDGTQSVSFLVHDRKWVMRWLIGFVRESKDAIGDQDLVGASIDLLGSLRCEEAVSELIDNITWQPIKLDQKGPERQTAKEKYPAVAALIGIGPRVSGLEALLKKAEESNQEDILGCTAAVLKGVLGKELALVYVTDRLETRTDEPRRKRLNRLQEQIEKARVP